ncbi:MAG: (2Fe-2S) ferredoxin domain-containing protein [Bacteroidia bacterium]|nr:(2Fe-2S) ferredoxin domain-containing protein [Bacteroidia bacterium]MCZ2248606.1 (2Fe-2S) ferredoxin domain-containing protein [Bacteroidia bacterium]
MDKLRTKYEKHIFVCVNQRAEGQRICCGEAHGLALIAAFKDILKEHHVKGTKVRAQKAGCFDICEYGPNVIIYPEGIYYGKVNLNDVREIVEQHVINNQPVERLRINFEEKTPPPQQ